MDSTTAETDLLAPVPRVSVVVPTLDEVLNVDALIEQLLAVFEREHLDAEILIADGGSKDGTGDHVREWEAREPLRVRLVLNDGPGGLSRDVLCGARAARGDVIVVMDADFSHPLDVVPTLANKVLSGEADMAIGSRYVPGGSTPGWPKKRLAASRAAALLCWPLVDVRDPLAGFFAIRRERLLQVDTETEGFKIGLEAMLVGATPPNVVEVPIAFHDRELGASKMSGAQVGAYVRRLLILAGGEDLRGRVRWALRMLFGWFLVDAGLFLGLSAAGATPGGANVAAGLAAWVVVWFLWAASTRRAATGTGPPTLALPSQGSFFTLGALLLVLRGGVMAVIEGVSGSTHVAFLIGFLVAAVFAGGACALGGRPIAERIRVRWRVVATLLVMASLLLRLVYLGTVELLPEEAYYWNYAQHPSLSYLDHPPMIAWLIGLGTWIFGDTEFGVRLGGFLAWCIGAGFVYGLTRRVHSKTAALVALALFAALPFYFVFGFFSTPDAPLVACWAGTLFFLEAALLRERRAAWWGAGLCLGLGLLAKYTMLLVVLGALVTMLVDRRARRWLLRPEPYLAGLLALVVFSPVILWNAQNEWASFVFQSGRRLGDTPEFSLHLLIGALVVLLSPVGFLAVFAALRRVPSGPEVRDPAMLRRYRGFAVCMIAPSLAVFTWFSLSHAPKPNWTGPVWLAALPLLAAHVAEWSSRERRVSWLFGPRAWAVSLSATLVLLGFWFHFLTLGLPWMNDLDVKAQMPIAWQEIAAQVREVEQRVEEETGRTPLIMGCDKYMTSSLLAFYGWGEPERIDRISGRHLVGRSSLMYEHWQPREEALGRPVITVDIDREDVVQKLEGARFGRLGPLEERVVIRHGRELLRYWLQVGYDYRGPR